MHTFYNLCKVGPGMKFLRWKKSSADVWVLRFFFERIEERFVCWLKMAREFLILIGCESLLKRRMWKPLAAVFKRRSIPIDLVSLTDCVVPTHQRAEP